MTFEERLEELAKSQLQLTNSLNHLVEVQARSDEKIDRLSEKVDRLTEKVDRLSSALDRLTTIVAPIAQLVLDHEARLNRLDGK